MAIEWKPVAPMDYADQKVAAHDEDPNAHAAIRTAIAGRYEKPQAGIPKTDLASDVQASLGKADSALQQHQSLEGYVTTEELEAALALAVPTLAGTSVNTNTTNGLRQAVRAIVLALGGTVAKAAAIALVFASATADGAAVSTAKLGDLDLDTNPDVVTGVNLDGLVTTNQLTNYVSKTAADVITGDKLFMGRALFGFPRTREVSSNAFAQGWFTSAMGAYAHAEGYNSFADGDYSHASGLRAVTASNEGMTPDAYAFAWQGADNNEEDYYSHGPGTFNVNPAGGDAGFWIGETTLADRFAAVSNYTDSATALTPFYSEWEIDVTYASPSAPDFYGLVWVPYDGHNDESFGWYVNTSNGRYSMSGYDKQLPSATRFILSDFGDGFAASFTATRHIVGYTLGSQADKPLASTNAVAAAIDRSVAVAAQSATNYVNATASTLYPKSSGETLATQVAAIGAVLNGEDARFVVTNYDSVVHTPEAYVEINVSNNWRQVWREGNRWEKHDAETHTWKTNMEAEVSHKADRAWGAYDSETGGYSPEGFTQLSSSNILVAAGMSYQRTVTSAGSVWVLQCNQGVATLGGDTNGYFRVCDGDGNAQLEVVQGDKRTLGADASGISVSNATTPPTVTINYSVIADAHPTLEITGDLQSPNWKDETANDCLANVSWSGTSGAYVATVQRKSAGAALFIKAKYEAGGETYIRNAAPTKFEGGILCTDGVHKVRPVYSNGSITWEVMQ